MPPKASFTPLHDAWIRRGALGVLFTSSVLLVQLPVGLRVGNPADFQSSPWHLLALGIAAALLIAASATVVLWLLPPAARRVAASIACAAGLVVWVQGNFVIGRMSVLNGQAAPMDFASGHSGWTMLAALIVLIAVSLLVWRAPVPTAFGLTLLTIGLYTTTIAAIASSPASQRQQHVEPDDDVYRFSSRENVLIVVLDGLQSDIAAEIIRKSPVIAKAFDGFHYYPDTAGAARTTFLSLPAIHSGVVYSPRRPPASYFVDAIKRRSFVNRFAAAGFDTVLLNPVESVCPARVRLCATATELVDTELARVGHESLQLLDLALFRASPVWLKRRIYNEGAWLTAGRIGVPFEVGRVFEGNELLELLADRLSVDDGRPALKFVHSLSTHTPYVLNSDCHSYGRASLAHLSSQVRCGLLAVVSLLNRLKEVGAYDNTVIAVIADHGVDPSVYGLTADDGESERGWPYLAGAANPVFLMKPQGSRGVLTQLDDAIHLTDLGNMLCERSRTCRVLTPVKAIDRSATRLRHFHDYDWRHEFWTLRAVENLRTYEIRGPVRKRSSWSRAETKHRDN